MSGMSILPFLSFFIKNYLRSHRYLREVVLIFVFNIFFWGFLYGSKPEDGVWTVFGVLALLLNMVSVPSLFYLEKGNSLYFPLLKPNGRLRFLFAKIAAIFCIDFFWVLMFALIYGIRFAEMNYFLLLVPRLMLLALLLALSTSLLSLSFSYKPWIVWLLLILVVFGGIINKSALFPFHSPGEIYALLTVLLPPFLEILFSAVTLKFPFWRVMFLLIATVQIGFYLYLNYRLIQKKDFV